MGVYLTEEQIELRNAGQRVWLTPEQIVHLNRREPFFPDRTWYRKIMAKIEAQKPVKVVIAPKRSRWERILRK